NNHYYFVFLKRVFFRLAEKIALENQCDFVVTGENLGQVSSQTLSNLATVAQATTFPIVRPLLGMEKNEIISLARQFGSHDISVGPELCDFLGSKKPATCSTNSQLEAEEKKIALNALLKDALHQKQVVSH
ncbi:hypothetical protein KKE06_04045, partial [Candidatus Micrarchaeota archaeon]|nr:hypothetical protein [Candidatus Micrarchaeota archaeon]MBU1930769.1 hypothetical protein [Candidatus Micrarchaeota archaeon]